MTDQKHPEGCMCDTCERLREREYMKEYHPERHRELQHIRGQDSDPDPVQQRIPDGMTERQARRAGYI